MQHNCACKSIDDVIILCVHVRLAFLRYILVYLALILCTHSFISKGKEIENGERMDYPHIIHVCTELTKEKQEKE